MNTVEDEELEYIKKDKKVLRALSETSISAKKEAPLLGVTTIIFLICGTLYFLLGWKRLPIELRSLHCKRGIAIKKP